MAQIEPVVEANIEGHASDFKVYQQQLANGMVDSACATEPAQVFRSRTVEPVSDGPSEVPQLVVFDIPDASWDGIYLNVYVDANNEGTTTVTLGPKVKRIAKGAFKGTKVTTLVVKTGKLTKKSAKGCLKGSKVKVVQVQVGGKKVAVKAR